MPRKPAGLPPGSRWNKDSGRITLVFEVDDNGQTRRLSQRAILKSEPKSYGTADEATDGYRRVRAFIASNADRHTTVLGFWQRWTDEDDWRWGVTMTGRSADTFVSYRGRTREFAKRFAARQLASMTETDVRAYMNAGGNHGQLPILSRFFADAMREGLMTSNPAEELGRTANRTANDRRRNEKKKTKPPTKPQIDAMLTRAASPAYPRSIYGWLLAGSETGMRAGELDAMEFEYVDGDVYHIQNQRHYRTDTLEPPKHESYRSVHLSAPLLAEIERSRAEDPSARWIWRNGLLHHWRPSARGEWWRWDKDGGPSLRSLVGGATMYQATRHHYAWYAINVLEISIPKVAHLYGHKDGGKTLLAHYADVDGDAAIESVRRARAAQPADLSARRRAA